MSDIIRNPQEIFLVAKSGAGVSDLEKQKIHRIFVSDFDNHTYYSLLALALLFPCTSESLERYRELFWHFRRNDMPMAVLEDRVAAIVTAVCVYWQSAAEFEEELKSILVDWPWEDWSDACIRAASSFSKLAFETHSKKRFDFLKDFVLRRYDEASRTEKSVLVDSCVIAMTGARSSGDELRARLVSSAAIGALELPG